MSNSSVTISALSDVDERHIEQERLLKQRNALIAITDHSESDLLEAIQFLTYIAAITLDTARVSVWLFTDDHSAIECLDLYELTSNKHSDGYRLESTVYPKYFQGMAGLSVIVADDARENPFTSEFTDHYLDPLGITSMLDAPIRAGNKVLGVLCHEHIGPRRNWTLDEQTFAFAVAHAVSLACERSERKAALETLKASEARARKLTDAAISAVVLMDPTGVVTFWNPSAERIFGYSREDALGRDIYSLFVPPGQLDRYSLALREALGPSEGGQPLDLEAVTASGTQIQLKCVISTAEIDGELNIIGVFGDVTEECRSRRELHTALAQLEQLLEHVPGVIFRLKIEGKTVIPVSASAFITRLLGYEWQEVSQISWWANSLHPDDRFLLSETFDEMFFSDKRKLEYRVRHKDGSYRWIEDNRTLLRNAAGEPDEIIGVWIDITDRKEKETRST